MYRSLIDDFKEFPATMALGAAWVAVFGLMLGDRLLVSPLPAFGQVMLGNFASAHRFGDMTLGELFHGEPWRAVTSTFVHYNVLHIAMNLYGLYQLGCLVESWYGPGQLLAIYAVIGGGGNLVSGLIRHALGSNPAMHSGGGSTVVLGLVALCAVVGWRSRTRVGDYLRGQMVGILVFTAILGQVLPIIDNWGHAGGALVGALVGLAHRTMIRSAHRRMSRWAGFAATVVFLASGAAQVRENRNEAAAQARLVVARQRLFRAEQIAANLTLLEGFYRLCQQRAGFERATFVPRAFLKRTPTTQGGRPLDPLAFIDPSDREFRAALTRQLAVLDGTRGDLGTSPTAGDFEALRTLLAHALDRPPTASSWREFHAHWEVLIRRVQRERAEAKARYEAIARGARLG